jgi:cell division protein FtsW
MRRGISLFLLLVPALALAALGVLMVTSTMARHATATFGDPSHFAVRHLIATGLALVVALAIVRAGPARVLQAAPLLFIAALLAALAVFVPGIGVRAAGARRWLHIGVLSGSPAPILTIAVGLIVSAWGRASLRGEGEGVGLPRTPVAGAGAPALATASRPAAFDALPRRALVLAMAFIAVLALVAEPDFSAAAIASAVALTALAGLGFRSRRLIPAAAALVLALALIASQFGYVGGRLRGFLAPELDRRGKGFEVLALARATAGATPGGAGLGHGEARRRLSSPGSDYVFAIVTDEMGKTVAMGVTVAWLCIAAAAGLAARGLGDRRLRAAALSSGLALLAPAALHVAVCTGLLPIIGVTMPLVSYDPAATLAAGAELGVIAAILLKPSVSPSPVRAADLAGAG